MLDPTFARGVSATTQHATYLAYTASGAGRVFPLVPGLLALRDRGHDIHLRTAPDLVAAIRRVGLTVEPVDPRIAQPPFEDRAGERLASHATERQLIEARALLTPGAFMGATTSAAVSCLDAPARMGLRSWPRVTGRLKRVDRLKGGLLGRWLWAPCAAWPVLGQHNYRGPGNAATRNPFLLIGTLRDPSTPTSNSCDPLRRLGNAVPLTQDGCGRVSFHDPSACIDRPRVAYPVSLVTPAKGTVCKSNRKPFEPGFGETP